MTFRFLNFTATRKIETSNGKIANNEDSGTEGDEFEVKVTLGNIVGKFGIVIGLING